MNIPSTRLQIKKRLKELQKNQLMAVHEALMTVLDEMKATGEVNIYFFVINASIVNQL